jgi:hypothetical protein
MHGGIIEMQVCAHEGCPKNVPSLTFKDGHDVIFGKQNVYG